jgi:hypothetical protein
MALHPEDPREQEIPPDVIIREALLAQTGLLDAYRQIAEFRYSMDMLVRQMLPAMVRGLAGDAAVAAHHRETVERLSRLMPPSATLLGDLGADG